jgi:hypothetical protein
MTQGVIEARAWLVSLACDKPRTTAIRMSCGRRGCWRAMHARTHRPLRHDQPRHAAEEAEHPHMRADPIRHLRRSALRALRARSWLLFAFVVTRWR